jgi:outer membrane receptor protein involved in Fe transport
MPTGSMRLYFIMMGMTLFSLRLLSQSSVSGIVIEKTSQKPIEFASIELIHLPDSSLSKGTATDKKGRFTIADVQPGNYFIRSSFIGYDKIQSSSFNLEAGGKYAIGQLELTSGSNTLAAVTVTGIKTQLNTSIDRKVYNVEQDIMSRSGTASDILRNIPSVEVDVEGNVALRGSGDVLILINGKPNPLMGRTRAEVLQNLPANSIERIEVITNPSARYRPDGTAGIINIVLKKNIRNGFNGTATINAGNKNRYNGNVSINYRPKNFNLFGSYSFRADTRKRYGTIDRTNLDSFTLAPKSFYTQTTNSVARPRTHIISGGLDYTLDEKNSIGASGTYYYREQLREDVANNLSFDSRHIITQDYDRLRYDPEEEKQKTGMIYFQHSFAKEDHDLRIEFNASTENEKEDNHYTNIYRLPSQKITKDNTLIQQGTKQNQLTIDYSNQLSEDSKLEAGYDGLYTKVDLNFYGEYYDEAKNAFVKDAEKSNRFIYNEDVHALYGTYQKSFEKFGYEIGLRSEAVFTKSHLADLDSFVNNNYFKIYPTVHLSYKLKESSELQLNYSKRVNRPEADELNPFPEFQDPRNLRAGNPKLLPEIIHSTELGYKWQNKHFTFVPSIYYRYKQNGFTSVVIPLNDTTLLSTTQNLSNDQSAGLETILSAKAGNFFNATLSTNIFYNRIDASNLGYIQNKSIYSFSSNLSSSFTITKTTMLQISSNYRSARLTPQGKTYPTIVVNSGMRQDLLKNKLSVTLTASDIFSSLRQKNELQTPYLQQVSINRRDGLIVFLGLSYRFGIIKKDKEEKLQFDNSL